MKLLNALKEIKHQGRCKIVTTPDVKLLKKGRDKNPIPENWNGLKKIVVQVADVGRSYLTGIQNHLEKTGINPENFDPENCRYSEVDPENPSLKGIIRRNKKNHDQKYIRIYQPRTEDNEAIKGNYRELFINSKGEIVEISLEEKENYFQSPPSKRGSQKQAESGCSKELVANNIKLENVVYFKKGDIIVNNLSNLNEKLQNWIQE